MNGEMIEVMQVGLFGRVLRVRTTVWAKLIAVSMVLMISATQAHANDAELSPEFLRQKIMELTSQPIPFGDPSISETLKKKILAGDEIHLVQATVQADNYDPASFNRYIPGCAKADFSVAEYDHDWLRAHKDFRLYLLDFGQGRIGKLMFARDYMRDSDWKKYGSVEALLSATPPRTLRSGFYHTQR